MFHTKYAMAFHMLITILFPIVMQFVIYFAVQAALDKNGHGIDGVGSALFWGFVQVALTVISFIIYGILLFLWLKKYPENPVWVKVIPFVPLLIAILVTVFRNINYQVQKKNFSADTYVSEMLEAKEKNRHLRRDEVSAIDAPDYLEWVCFHYWLDRTQYDLTQEEVEEIARLSLPVIMEDLMQEPLCVEDFNNVGRYDAVTIEHWEMSIPEQTLRVKYDYRDDVVEYHINLD